MELANSEGIQVMVCGMFVTDGKYCPAKASLESCEDDPAFTLWLEDNLPAKHKGGGNDRHECGIMMGLGSKALADSLGGTTASAVRKRSHKTKHKVEFKEGYKAPAMAVFHLAGKELLKSAVKAAMDAANATDGNAIPCPDTSEVSLIVILSSARKSAWLAAY